MPRVASEVVSPLPPRPDMSRSRTEPSQDAPFGAFAKLLDESAEAADEAQAARPRDRDPVSSPADGDRPRPEDPAAPPAKDSKPVDNSNRTDAPEREAKADESSAADRNDTVSEDQPAADANPDPGDGSAKDEAEAAEAQMAAVILAQTPPPPQPTGQDLTVAPGVALPLPPAPDGSPAATESAEVAAAVDQVTIPGSLPAAPQKQSADARVSTAPGATEGPAADRPTADSKPADTPTAPLPGSDAVVENGQAPLDADGKPQKQSAAPDSAQTDNAGDTTPVQAAGQIDGAKQNKEADATVTEAKTDEGTHRATDTLADEDIKSAQDAKAAHASETDKTAKSEKATPGSQRTSKHSEAPETAAATPAANALPDATSSSATPRPDGVQGIALTGQTSSTAAATPLHLVQTNAANDAVPLSGLAVEIAARAKDGKRSFEIRLDPPELGRIDVRLDVDRNGHVASRMVVDRPETLDLLRRDASSLERALQSAGLKTEGGVEFSLRDQNFTGREQNTRDNSTFNNPIVVPDDEPNVDIARRTYGRLYGSATGVDIRV